MARNTFSEEWLRYQVSRRSFVAGGLVLFATSPVPLIGQPSQTPPFAGPPFSLGVASGDPTPDGVVLWTRLAPVPLEGGGMPDEAVEVAWTVARDERMTQVVQRGTVVATPALGHAVHVEVEGLDPDRWYWYRFRSGGEVSRVGRTRTLPAPGAQVNQLRMAFVSCQHYETGYRHMLEDDLDLVFHLGVTSTSMRAAPAGRGSTPATRSSYSATTATATRSTGRTRTCRPRTPVSRSS